MGFWDNAAFGTTSPAETADKPPNLWDRLLSGAVDSLYSLPQRAIQNSQFAVNTGNYDPGPTMEAATLPMGTGAVAGVPVRAGEAVLGAGPIRAYHASPYDFDKFDFSKIGTGEGAQAYGHGGYFAGNEAVAKEGYLPALRHKAPVPDDIISLPPEMRQAIQAHAATDVGPLTAAKRAQYMSTALRETPLPQVQDMIERYRDAKRGRMYEVNINADPEHFLDWDKPLAADHPVRDKLKEIAQMGLDAHEGGVDRQLAKDAFMHAQNPNLTGEGAYRQMTNAIEAARPALKEAGNPRALFGGTAPLANEQLTNAGIPGIKYLDQGSRGSGQGTSNYVVFDPKMIEIMRKYGIAGATPLAAGLGLTGQDNSQ